MAPHGESLVSSYTRSSNTLKPPRLSSSSETTGLKRSVSDVSFELTKEDININTDTKVLPTISEVEDIKCECCGMMEECTHEYIERIREKFIGKWICGLCSEAVKEEMDKNGGKREEALSSHMNACVRFNKFGRAYPVLYQAQAMREILKKARAEGRGVRAKSMNYRNNGGGDKKGSIARSSSCIPAITREMNDLRVAK